MKKLLSILFYLPIICFSQQTSIFFHDGINREYIYYSPNGLPSNAPLVFVAHAFGGSAQAIRSSSGMNTIADQNGFAVCYPQGTEDNWGDNFWNVGYDFHSGVTIDDVGFLESLASHLQLTHQLSVNNTFFTGMSNGGEMCYLLAYDGSNIFKAFAPVAGTVFPNGLINNLFTPNLPIPFFVTHADNDNVTFFEGDPNDQYWGPYLSVDTLVNFWVNYNFLSNLNIDTFPDINSNGKITISYKYTSALNNNQVWLYKHQSGHNWGDDGDMVIEQEIWDFFLLMSNNLTEVNELSNTKELLSVTNLLGQKSNDIKNKLFLYIYDDGSVEKKIILE